MKKSILKLTSAILCLVILVGFLPSVGLARSSSPHFTTYTVLGDSNPSGFGLDAYYENAGGMKIKDGDLIEGSYPAIVAEAINASTVNVFSHCAWRANELLRVIDPEFDWDDGYSGVYYSGLGFDDRFGYDTDAFAAKIPAAIKSADVITMQFGSNDIFTHSLNRTTNEYPDLLESLKITLPENVSEALTFCLFLEAAERAGLLRNVVTTFLSFLDENSQIFMDNMTRAIEKVREMNPTAQIYVVGALNSINMTCQPFDNMFLSPDSKTDARFRKINQYLKQVCDSMDNCFFVDVPDTDMYGIAVFDLKETLDGDGIPYTALKIVHPTPKGHKYMAEQIIESIRENYLPAPEVAVSKSKIFKNKILKWNYVADAEIYRIYRSTSADGEYSYVGSTNLNVFYDLNSDSHCTYYYKVSAVSYRCYGNISYISKPQNK